MKMTPARRAWLETVDAAGVVGDDVRRSPAGWWCRHFGWTEWVYRAPDGTPVARSEVDAWRANDPARYGAFIRDFNTAYIGEQLTPAGRAALEKARGE